MNFYFSTPRVENFPARLLLFNSSAVIVFDDFCNSNFLRAAMMLKKLIGFVPIFTEYIWNGEKNELFVFSCRHLQMRRR